MLNNIKKIVLFFILISNFCLASDLDFKIGQMIIVGFSGNSVNSHGFKKVLSQAKNNQISGVILFSKNIKSKEDLIKMNERLIQESTLTPFISIDNEGGEIQRYNFIKTKSAKEVSRMGKKEAREEYAKMAQVERELKINLNFAPCTDLDLNPDSIISKKQRSYSKDPKTVIKYSKIFIEEHNKKNIITSIKHFPGHGSALGDTHKGFVDNTKTFKKEELEPYIALKNYDDKNMVMVSHIYNSNIDEKYPASLSEKTVKKLLKEEIGFKGVVISDDYDMGAIRKNYTLEQIVINSINSGVNILLFSNNINTKDYNLPLKIQKIVKKAIKTGEIKQEDIENSYEKILELKRGLSS